MFNRFIWSGVLGGFFVSMFYATVFFDTTFCYRDLQRFFLPYADYYVTALRQGALPLWNPYLYCGMPFLATLQSHVLYPPNLLLLWAPYPRNLTIFLLFHYAVSLWLMYCLAKRLGQSPAAAAFAAMCWMGSGYLLSVLDMVTTLCAAAWLPAVIHAGLDLHQHTLEGESRSWRRSLAILSGFLTLTLMGGEPTVAYAAGLLLVGAAIWHGRLIIRNVFGLATAYVAALCLGAAQFLPFAEYVAQSNRSGGVDFWNASSWSLPPLHAWTLVFPFLLGDQMLTEANWYDVSQLWIKSPYMGVIPLALAWIGWRSIQSQSASHISWQRYWGWAALAGAILMVGKYTPLYAVLYRILPGLNYLRYPAKFLVIWSLAIALLAGWGWDRLRRENSNDVLTPGTLGGLIVAFTALLGFGLWCWIDPEAFSWIARDRVSSFISLASHRFSQLPLAIYGGVVHASAQRGLIFLLVTAVLFWFWKKTWLTAKGVTAALFLVTSVDLLSHGWTLNPSIPSEAFRMPSENMQYVRDHLPSDRRVYAYRDASFAFGKTNLERTFYVQATMDPNESMRYGLPYATGYETLVPKRYQYLMNALREDPTLQRARILTFLNVGYFLSMRPINSPWLKKERRDIVNIYRYTGPSQRALCIRQVTLTPLIEEARQFVFQKEFDPLTMAAIEPAGNQNPLPLANPPPRPRVPDQVERLESSIHRVAYRVKVETPTYFVLSESYDPGWKALVDGQETTVHPANVLFRAVYLSAGSHEIVFRYEPGSFYVGLWISGLSAAILLTLAWWPLAEPPEIPCRQTAQKV